MEWEANIYCHVTVTVAQTLTSTALSHHLTTRIVVLTPLGKNVQLVYPTFQSRDLAKPPKKLSHSFSHNLIFSQLPHTKLKISTGIALENEYTTPLCLDRQDKYIDTKQCVLWTMEGTRMNVLPGHCNVWVCVSIRGNFPYIEKNKVQFV